MPTWTVIIRPDEREVIVSADALEVSGGALVFSASGQITRVYAPNGYESVRLEAE